MLRWICVFACMCAILVYGEKVTAVTNRLANEKSPYLLQHADNPVDWYPWGSEAFEKAKKEDKPIFLSIGYSTCHWCHVMEHESFEDEEVARLMNDVFISIKVDREERPDIDQIYMTVCQMMTGSGGWPLSIVMTPDKKPFFAGTYFPKDARFGRIGMMELVPRISGLWKNERAKLLETAEKVIGGLQKQIEKPTGRDLDEKTLQLAFEQLRDRYDPRLGGFGEAPKFPTAHNFSFLLRYGKRNTSQQAIDMVKNTLRAMRRGGIYDHVGFGFHRYSTDPFWLLPHFEKMLYDQALLAIAYLEVYQLTHEEEFAQTAREIFEYVLRDMTSPEGGFYSAEDADSEGEEGKFYVWSVAEIGKILPKKDAELVQKVYGFEGEGNFVEQATGKRTGANIIHLKKPLEEVAKDFGMAGREFEGQLEEIRKKLFAVREKRVHPHKDDKILTDWNGLMIAALAKGAAVLGEPKYAHAAERAANFALNKLRRRDLRGDLRLLHRYRDGETGIDAHLDDYVFFVLGLLELYEATFEIRYLEEAIRLNDLMIIHFWDEKNGGVFFSADGGEELVWCPKQIYHGAGPLGD